MNPTFIGEQQVEDVLLKDAKKYLDYMRMRMESLNKGTERLYLPEKMLHLDPFNKKGDIRNMVCFTEKVKCCKLIATNPVRQSHKSVSVGHVTILDQRENFPTHIIAGTTFSGIRTAAVMRLAAHYAKVDMRYITFIGMGRVNRYLARLLAEEGKWEGIQCYDPAMLNPLPDAKKIWADVVFAATTSTYPFIGRHSVEADLIVSAGADTDYQREIQQSMLQDGRTVYVDTYDAYKVGDLKGACVVPHGDLMTLAKRPEKVDVFISVGSALYDALTAEFLLGEISDG